MDDRERFFLVQEDNGNFLRIYIPGKRPDNWPTRQIKWTGKDPIPSFDEFHREAARKLAHLKKKGLPQNLPEKIIPGYSHSYAYAFHPSTIPEINPNPKDQIYIRNDVYYNMRHMLWYPLREVLREKIGGFDYIQLELPVFPPILLEDACQSWYENNQRSATFFERLSQTSQDTHIEPVVSQTEVTFKITNHPFVEKPVQRIQLLPEETGTALSLSDEQLRLLHLKVLCRDSNILKGLTDSERKQLRKGANADLVDAYPIHWVRWLSLSGQMNEKNAIIVSANIAKSYQFSVHYPFLQYWRRNRSFWENQKLPVFVEVPIPSNGYRSKPVPHTLTRHPKRHHLNNMVRHAVQEYFMEKE